MLRCAADLPQAVDAHERAMLPAVCMVPHAQTDIHTPLQTVKEALTFSARLRLPTSVSDEKVRARARGCWPADMLPPEPPRAASERPLPPESPRPPNCPSFAWRRCAPTWTR